MGGRRSVSGSAERPCGYNESGGGVAESVMTMLRELCVAEME